MIVKGTYIDRLLDERAARTRQNRWLVILSNLFIITVVTRPFLLLFLIINTFEVLFVSHLKLDVLIITFYMKSGLLCSTWIALTCWERAEMSPLSVAILNRSLSNTFIVLIDSIRFHSSFELSRNGCSIEANVTLCRLWILTFINILSLFEFWMCFCVFDLVVVLLHVRWFHSLLLRYFLYF